MKHFLIAGNTRVGSTWVLSSLHFLPGVFGCREVRWKMPYFNQQPLVHSYIDSSTRSMKEKLDRVLLGPRHQGITTIGAKLKFDPYGFVPPEAFANLKKIIENDIHIFMLRRSYLEIFETWKSYGIRHIINPNATWMNPNATRGKNVNGDILSRIHETEKKKATIRNFDRFSSMHGSPLEQKNIILTRGGEVISSLPQVSNLHTFELGENIHYPIEEAIQDLFVLFFNDVFILSLLKKDSQDTIIDYKDIDEKFFSVAQTLSEGVSREECQEILATAATGKIETEGVQLVFPDNALKEISRYLDTNFNKIKNGDLRINDIIRYNKKTNTISFCTPGFESVLQNHEETDGMSFKSVTTSLFQRLSTFFERNEYWLAQRPVYLPGSPAKSTKLP